MGDTETLALPDWLGVAVKLDVTERSWLPVGVCVALGVNDCDGVVVDDELGD